MGLVGGGGGGGGGVIVFVKHTARFQFQSRGYEPVVLVVGCINKGFQLGFVFIKFSDAHNVNGNLHTHTVKRPLHVVRSSRQKTTLQRNSHVVFLQLLGNFGELLLACAADTVGMQTVANVTINY
jgi:hypothetical protein